MMKNSTAQRPVVQQDIRCTTARNTGYKHFITFRIEDTLYNDYQKLKQQYSIIHDSELLRVMVRIGIVAVPWLKQAGYFDWSQIKLKKILAGLDAEDRATLFDMLKQEFQV